MRMFTAGPQSTAPAWKGVVIVDSPVQYTYYPNWPDRTISRTYSQFALINEVDEMVATGYWQEHNTELEVEEGL